MNEIPKTLNPAQFRCNEASYFFDKYRHHSGLNGLAHDSYKKMVYFFDASLFAIISIEGLLADDDKEVLRNQKVFRFLKALRNINTHPSVLAASLFSSKFERSFSHILRSRRIIALRHIECERSLIKAF